MNDTIHNWLGQAEDDDLILIYIVSHGDIEGEHKFFVLNNRDGHYYVYDYEFNQMLSGLNYKTMVIAMQTCYSGGFIEELTAPGRIIITACNKTTEAIPYPAFYAGHWYYKANFTFVDAFDHNNPNFPEVDSDGNGKVSIMEAFVFAYVNDLARINGLETPQLYNFGLAGTTFLEQPKICRLTIWASYGGTTNPSPRNHYYFAGTEVTIKSYPNSEWRFDYWFPDDYPYPSLAHIFLTNPEYTVTMDKDHLIYAYFLPEDDEAGGGDWPYPTLFVWNGSGYVDYGVINIHNPSGEDVVKKVLIQPENVGTSNCKAKFRLREGWESLNFSESVIDQVKLYAVDNQGNRYLCPLIKAEHSNLGKVLSQLLKSDDVRVQILLLETIDLTFTVPYPTSQIHGYIFAIEGCNKFKM